MNCVRMVLYIINTLALPNQQICTDVTVLSSNYSPAMGHLTISACSFNIPQEFCSTIMNADYQCMRILILRQFAKAETFGTFAA